ncbi:MAG: SAM-dependent methyltransferase [Actinobacteria bacterium]|nr:SAM-dependent methyltransferase [Actinomycetota bacterium]
MKIDLNEAVAEVAKRIKQNDFVRAVLSGRRRNMQPGFERVDIKPVTIKDEIKLQIISNDGRQATTKNVDLDFNFTDLLHSGFANLQADSTSESYSIRISKKDEALVAVGKVKLERVLNHDRVKQRLLAENNPIFNALDMSDVLGRIKPGKIDKYKQVEEFLRLLSPTIEGEIKDQESLTVVDLGCGHAYLTFGVQEFCKNMYKNVSILGVDERADSKEHNEKVAAKLKVDAKFLAAKIADTPAQKVDIAIALHACDTATDDAIAWAVNNDAKVMMVAPCCMHELQTQVKEAPEPWGMLTKYGLVKERLVDLMTDSLRAQILKLLGYRVDIVEFIGGEHTARNIMIRAVKTGAAVQSLDKERYEKMLKDWNVTPYLAKLLSAKLKAAAAISNI